MLKRILCPNHKEKTPSFVLYPQGSGYCFSCGYYEKTVKAEVPAVSEPRYIENVDSKIEWIKTLPKKTIRGLYLPYDSVRYYLLWPNANYYKSRLFNAANHATKYKNPAGIQKPLFWAMKNYNSTLLIVEGEFNALSITLCYRNADICSPGSATELDSVRYLTAYRPYNKIIIIADNDAPGAIGAIKLKSKLLSSGKEVRIELFNTDANDILVQDGKETLAAKIKELAL